MLGRSGVAGIKALMELALDPPRWRSVSEIAAAQALPAPMLEQLLLKLRRADLLEARRGRQGGYRLRRPPAAIPLAAILSALAPQPGPPAQAANLEASEGVKEDPSDRVTRVLNHRLHHALERELTRLTLEDLLFDLRSARAALSDEGGLMLRMIPWCEANLHAYPSEGLVADVEVDQA